MEWIEFKIRMQHEKQVKGLSLFIEGNYKNRVIIFIHEFPYDYSAWQVQVDMFSSECSV